MTNRRSSIVVVALAVLSATSGAAGFPAHATDSASLSRLLAVQRELLTADSPAAGAGASTPVALLDVDGDGASELVSSRATEPDTLRVGPVTAAADPSDVLELRRGVDGSVAWAIPRAVMTSDAEMTGEGSREIVAVRVELVRLVPGPARLNIGRLRQSVLVLNGSTGTIVLEHVVDGIVALAGDAYSVLEWTVVGWDRLLVTAGTGGDADGDGDSELFLGTSSSIAASMLKPVAADAGTTRFVAETIDVPTGTTIGVASLETRVQRECETGECEASASPAGELRPWVWPAPDLDGDGRSDVIGVSFEAGGGTLSAMSTAGAPIWSAQIGARSVVPWIEDLDGDGDFDLLVRSAFGDGTSVALTGRDGSTGATIWSDDVPSGYDVIPASRVDADSGMDFFLPDSQGGGLGDLRAISGADGRVVWVKDPRTLPGRLGGLPGKFLCRLADLTGDGARDLLVHARAADSTWSSAVLSGRDGSVLYSVDPTQTQTVPGLDVNRNGTTDIAEFVVDGATLVVNAREGASFAAVWSADLPSQAASASPSIVVGGDLDGDGEGEIVLGIASGDERRIYAVGATGILWSA